MLRSAAEALYKRYIGAVAGCRIVKRCRKSSALAMIKHVDFQSSLFSSSANCKVWPNLSIANEML